MLRFFLFVLSFLLSESNAISPVRCMNQNQKCDMHGNNLIQSEAGVTGPECQQLCEDTTDCNVFTYFGPNSFPYHEFCMLYIFCDTLDDCQDCVTVNVKSDCTCGISYEGSIDSDNIVEIKENVQNEQDCRSLCSSKSSCSVYTYYDDGHVTDVRLCLLLTVLHDSVRSCENCQTGSDKCEAFTECSVGVWDGGDQFSVNKFLATESKTVKYVSGESGCYKTVNAVAVGSGPDPRQDCGYSGGGGSGYINAKQIVLRANSILFKIDITGTGTAVTRQDTQEILLSAANGKPGTECGYGGDGYSGGGAGGNPGAGDGASDGQDGQDGADSRFSEGKGSGFDMTSIVMQYYQVSYGKGGITQGSNGGGGGGLLVDGSGPEFVAGVGEGYGGGGLGNKVSGSPGYVILEL